MELLIKFVIQCIASFCITFCLVPIFSYIAQYFKIIDQPDGKIKLHEKPVPYLGGVAVFLGFLCSCLLFLPYDSQVVLLLIGMAGLLLVGVIDDIFVLQAHQKFVWQCAAAFFLVFSGFYLKESFFLTNIWGIPLSILWILSIVNAFNLIDVMDGLASVTAMGVTFSIMIMAFLLGQPAPALILNIFLGALFAFFMFNKPPAKIYLGDAGSLMIGGFLATMPFLLSWNMYTPIGFLTPIIIFAIPLLEVLFLVVIRTYKGIPFFKASPDHFCMYLRRNGMEKNGVLAYVIAISIWLLIWSIVFASGIFGLLQHVLLALLFFFIWFFFLFFNFRLRRIAFQSFHNK